MATRRSKPGRTKAGRPPKRAPRPKDTDRAGARPARDNYLARTQLARDLFWSNIVREVLTNLSILSAKGAGAAPSEDAPADDRPRAPEPASPSRLSLRDLGAAGATGPADDDEGGDGDDDADLGEALVRATPARSPAPGKIVRRGLFDGRLAVITALGQRIPIAEVHPLFACGVPGPKGETWLSTAVECTVFEITTPGGEVFTLPVHEIRAIHALTDELMRAIEEQIGGQGVGEEDGAPFGFAAFTSLARSGDGPRVSIHPPDTDFMGE